MAINKVLYAVEIRQVANGFVVLQARSLERPSVIHDSDTLVFHTFAELTKWLDYNFDHRN